MNSVGSGSRIARYRENEPLVLEGARRTALRSAIDALKRSLQPHLPQFEERGDYCVIRNLIGTVALPDGTLVEVVPKTRPGGDWVRAVLSLLVANRIEATGDRVAGLSAPREDLAAALARLYADRLERALRRDGPLLLMRRYCHASTTLKGRLDVTRWLRDAWKRPVPFPVEISQLSADNDFSRALAIVASILASAARDHTIAARLRAAARALRPGSPAVAALPTGIERRTLPSQWAVYSPAWSIAVAVLARRSPLHPEGMQRGIAVAIEPWPLMEELLKRSLEAAALVAMKCGRIVIAKHQGDIALLRNDCGAVTANVTPDGRLIEGERTLATIDAKYRDRSSGARPTDDECYQALAQARAADAPVAVLAYPDDRPPVERFVQPPGTCPERLLTVGLDLFAYRWGSERTHGRTLWELIR